MYIRVAEIPEEGLDVFAGRGKESIPRMLEGMDPFPLRAIRLLAGRLFLKMEKKDLLVTGSFTAEGEAQCDRCTEPFPVRLEKEFHAVLVTQEERAAGSMVELHPEDLEVSFYDGVGVRVADILWEQVAMAFPTKLLCREECQGICPRCGANRNVQSCSCADEREAGPFEVLKTLKEKKE